MASVPVYGGGGTLKHYIFGRGTLFDGVEIHVETSQFSTIFHNFPVPQKFTIYLIVNYLGSLARALLYVCAVL